MIEAIVFLLPIAAYSGWIIGRKAKRESDYPEDKSLSRGYLVGLNYLLNEQPDKAIDTFVSILQVNSETVEINLAVGNLFRQRGEVERAIRLHQNIIARPALSDEHRSNALYELGLDYMSAGLLDRAENIFIELANNVIHGVQSLKQLLIIYQKTHEWLKAIDVSSRLQKQSDIHMRPTIVHFYCELADEQIHEGDLRKAQNYLKKAVVIGKGSIRTSIMLGHLSMRKLQPKAALKYFREITDHDIHFLVEVLEDIIECYHQLNDRKGLMHFLHTSLEKGGGISIILALADIIRTETSEKAAKDFMIDKIKSRPSMRGLKELVDLQLQEASQATLESFHALSDVVDRLLESKPKYHCYSCGFDTKKLYWQCPRCKEWETIRPIVGIEGE
ncbi:MAG: lipopolysaccharide assembly protein LapB [Pseudomonadota bacterium]